jgi:hypothetical protein
MITDKISRCEFAKDGGFEKRIISSLEPPPLYWNRRCNPGLDDVEENHQERSRHLRALGSSFQSRIPQLLELASIKNNEWQSQKSGR